MKKILFLAFTYFLLLKNVPGFSQTSVLTQHNDAMRTGWDSTETILNKENVNVNYFGFLFSRPLDDQMYAQPLVVSDVTVSRVKRNIVYAATVNNSVYAYDADSGSITSPYWQINLTEGGMRPPTNVDVNGYSYMDFTGKVGIVGTPVIDTLTQKLFVVARSVDVNHNFYQYLHSIDITTGADTKVLITAQITGTGAGSQSGIISFNPIMQNQRCALLLENGVIYIAYASHADDNPYHGWILGYDEHNLSPKYIFMDTPNDSAGGIWMSGAGPAADNLGNVYVASGNGTGIVSNTNLQMGIFKLTPDSVANSLSETSFFTPYNYNALDQVDNDFGPIQVLLIPNSNRALTGCKNGYLYLVDRDNMGGVGTASDANLQTLNVYNSMHSSFGYYKGTGGEYIYLWPEGEPLNAIPYNRTTNLLDNPATNTTLQGPTGTTGAFLSTSSKGTNDSTAILWATHAVGCNANEQTCPGILRAIDASDITKELWNSNLLPSDAIGNLAKFSCPTIANGKVYVATFSNKLMVYGLKTIEALPISLASFEANRLNNSIVSIKWKTVEEQNNRGFEIQRSNINSYNKFQTVSFVPSRAINGNSVITLDYQFKDTNTSNSKTFYRLAQMNMEGKLAYSKVVAVYGVGSAGKPAPLLLVVPNPSSGSMFTVKYKLMKQGNVVLKVNDIDGRMLQNISIMLQSAGTHKYQFSNLNLLPGFYIITLESDNKIIAKEKFIVNQ